MNAQDQVRPGGWTRNPAPWFLLWALALLLTFIDVFEYFVYVWNGSSTFAHGFFIVPLALYFAWAQRYRYIGLPPAVSRSAALLLALAVLAEFVGYLFSVSIIQQFAVVGVMVCGVITFVGWQVARQLWFPLSLLLFVPPVGNELIPVFQAVTADLSVWMLGVSPIPVHHDGLYITIPGQVFEVAEACSGIRFFVTCVFLGYIYAAINFVSLPKRVLFLLFAVALPILANGLRVFGIIMLGYYVDMKYAKGFDHLFVGWVFFFIITAILLLVGFLFADRTPRFEAVAPHAAWRQLDWRKPFLLVILPLVLSVALKASLNLNEPNGEIRSLREAVATSQPALRGANWSPVLSNPDGTLAFPLRVERFNLNVFIGWYNDDKPGSKLVTGTNHLYDSALWSTADSQPVQINVQGEPVEAQALIIVSPSGLRRFVLYWYEIPGFRSANKLKIKLYQGVNKITRQFRGGKLLVVSGVMRPADELDDVVDTLQKHMVFDVVDEATGL